MAMNKKEQAQMAEAIHKANLLAALRWTCPVERDVPPPEPDAPMYTYSSGWDFNQYSRTVYVCWSSSSVHGDCDAPQQGCRYRYSHQSSKHLYSSRNLALQALRHATELEYAGNLAWIDDELRKETLRM
jgi:hypothetical protein